MTLLPHGLGITKIPQLVNLILMWSDTFGLLSFPFMLHAWYAPTPLWHVHINKEYLNFSWNKTSKNLYQTDLDHATSLPPHPMRSDRTSHTMYFLIKDDKKKLILITLMHELPYIFFWSFKGLLHTQAHPMDPPLFKSTVGLLIFTLIFHVIYFSNLVVFVAQWTRSFII